MQVWSKIMVDRVMHDAGRRKEKGKKEKQKQKQKKVLSSP
jgi:hypothetical protein